jgi:hypothetical protein
MLDESKWRVGCFGVLSALQVVIWVVAWIIDIMWGVSCHVDDINGVKYCKYNYFFYFVFFLIIIIIIIKNSQIGRFGALITPWIEGSNNHTCSNAVIVV